MAISTPSESVVRAQQPLLTAVCRDERVPAGSAQWDQLLDFQQPLTSLDPAQLAASLQPFCESLGQAGLASGNLRSFLWHIYGLLRRQPLPLLGSSLPSALLFTRTVAQYVLETYDIEHVKQLLDAGSASDSGIV